MNCLSIILPILGIRGLNVKVASGESRLTWRGVETLDLDAVVPVFHRILAGIDDQRRTPTHRFRRRDAAPVGRSRRRRGRRPRGCSGAPSQSRRRHRKNKQNNSIEPTTKKGTRKLDTCLVLGCCCCFVVAAEFKPSPTNHRPVRTETEKNNNNDNDGLGRRDATEPTTSPVLGFLRDFRGCPSLPTRPPNHPTTQPPTHPPGSPPLQPPASHAGGSLLFFFLLPPIFFSSGAPH